MGIKSLVKDKKGFTIIEVVLVLAIAGLIFLMVFLAWPALQRGQKDTQRKDDMARFGTALNSYQSNNNGNIPKDGKWDDFVERYLTVNGDSFQDPDSDETYKVSERGADQGSENLTFGDYTIYVYKNAKCDGENAIKDGGKRNVAYRYKLEGGGTYCGNN